MIHGKRIGSRMREHKRLSFTLDIKSIDNQGRFAGYASVFDVVDRQRDVMLRGAFISTLKDRVGEIKLLWQHHQEEPIGIFDRIFEDVRGLYVEGRLLLDVARAKEAYSLLKAGAIGGLSIGYSPVRYHIDDVSGVRMIAEVELWEISLVTFPANAAANVTVVKQAEPLLSNYEIEQWNQALRAGQLIELQQAIDQAINTLDR